MKISISKIRRPFGVTLLALGVLILGIMNLLRLGRAASQWDFLAGVLRLSPVYLLASGLAWCLICILLFWGVWLGCSWAPRLVLLAALLYSTYYWIDRLFVAAGDAVTNWPFAAAANLILIIFLLWIFSLNETKAYFGVRHDG